MTRGPLASRHGALGPPRSAPQWPPEMFPPLASCEARRGGVAAPRQSVALLWTLAPPRPAPASGRRAKFATRPGVPAVSAAAALPELDPEASRKPCGSLAEATPISGGRFLICLAAGPRRCQGLGQGAGGRGQGRATVRDAAALAAPRAPRIIQPYDLSDVLREMLIEAERQRAESGLGVGGLVDQGTRLSNPLQARRGRG